MKDLKEQIKDFEASVIQEAHTKGTQEALAKVEEWVKAQPTVNIEMHNGEQSHLMEQTDLLHHLQQLKDNKTV